jgi:hypothetical protein
MQNLVTESVKSARKTLTSKKAEAEADEQVLAGEISVLERHAVIVGRLASARTDFDAMSAMLKDRYTGDAVPAFAAQLAADSTRVDWAAGELSKIEAVRANLPRILAEFEKCTVHACQADLKAFEAEHKGILRKHGAIN